MKRSALRLFAVFAVGATGMLLAVATPDDPPPPANAGSQPAAVTTPPVLCPVTGKPIDRECVERFRGRWVYFASAEAAKKFLDDPYEYADGVTAQWEADKPLRVQVKCPVTGEAVDPNIFTGKGQTAIYFANKDALARWEKDDKPFLKRLIKDCYTFQTGCATCGMPIKPQVMHTIDGHELYFCCEGCAGGFEQDKATHLKRVKDLVTANEAAWLKQQAEQRKAPKKPE